ncbi:MAG: hypothetical protein JWN70_1395 [Planctomycetaceae bacterium]|nr:hypothetical protein [Planctomycetaceae bacterium]
MVAQGAGNHRPTTSPKGVTVRIPEQSGVERKACLAAVGDEAIRLVKALDVDLKYQIEGHSPQLTFSDLVAAILNRLTEVYGEAHRVSGEPIGWQHFEGTTDDQLVTLVKSLFKTAHLIAGLAAVDGAVILNKHHDILGFGGMISGKLPAVQKVVRALDLEGATTAEEAAGNVGARHRSAYRLVNALPGTVAIVISQDGGVRFIVNRFGRVTYWEQELARHHNKPQCSLS